MPILYLDPIILIYLTLGRSWNESSIDMFLISILSSCGESGEKTTKITGPVRISINDEEIKVTEVLRLILLMKKQRSEHCTYRMIMP